MVSADAYRKAIEELLARQQRLLERFAPGRLIVIDVPHFMEPVIADLIPEEAELLIANGPAVAGMGESWPGDRGGR